MNNKEFLDSIKKLESLFFSIEFSEWLDIQTVENQKKMVDFRSEVSDYLDRSENNQLRVIADKLEKLSPELEAGITKLEDEIKKMNDFIAAINTLERVIGLIARIAAMAA